MSEKPRPTEERPGASRRRAPRRRQKGAGRRRTRRAGEDAEGFALGAKIKVLRRARKKTLQEVADETGFSPALISQIENDNVSPPIATLSRIARVLGVGVGYFFRDEGPEHEYEVVRREERPAVTRVISRTGGEQGYTYHALTFRKRDRIMDPYLLTVDPGMRDEESTYSHEGEEFLTVLKGEVELLLDRERIVLREGDSVYFESSLRHRLLAHGDGGARVLAVLAKGS